MSSESCPRQPRRLCPLCPQVRVEWDRDARAIGRRHVCNELGERVGWVRVRKVAPCMCCARPLAHAFCSAFQLGAKTGAKGLPTGTAQLQPARKKFIAELRAAISDRSSCTAGWRPALLLCSSAACWTTGLREARYSYFYPTFDDYRRPGAGGNLIFVPVPSISKKNKRAQQLSLGWVLPRVAGSVGGVRGAHAAEALERCRD